MLRVFFAQIIQMSRISNKWTIIVPNEKTTKLARLMKTKYVVNISTGVLQENHRLLN